MSAPPAKSNRRRRKKAKQVDLWRPVPALPDPEPIAPASDPTALLRSLGDPPLPGQAQEGAYHLARAVSRAAGLASALALTAGLLAEQDDDE